jgi:lipopolysaccharide/colanic/teichoic acid biosynthesis glycosyltransferase
MNTQFQQLERDGIAQQSARTSKHRVDNPPSSAAVVPIHRWYLKCKVAADFVAALLLLVPGIPIIVVAAICVKLTSRGPAFYSQTRVGYNGKLFKIYKLRSMVQDAEAKTGAVWCGTNDSRITPVGRWLRDLHIDEFPQLLNVLLCQMSLVGPRPERPEFVNSLEWELPDYRQRLLIRPGVTGIAQLNLPPDSDVESVRKKLIHDIYYIRHCSPWLDAKIIYFTGWKLLTSMFARPLRAFVLPTKDEVHRRVAQFTHVDSQLFAENVASEPGCAVH